MRQGIQRGRQEGASLKETSAGQTPSSDDAKTLKFRSRSARDQKVENIVERGFQHGDDDPPLMFRLLVFFNHFNFFPISHCPMAISGLVV